MPEQNRTPIAAARQRARRRRRRYSIAALLVVAGVIAVVGGVTARDRTPHGAASLSHGKAVTLALGVGTQAHRTHRANPVRLHVTRVGGVSTIEIMSGRGESGQRVVGFVTTSR
jgi:hypothetical protein